MSDDWHRAIQASPGGYRAYRKIRAVVLVRDGHRCRLGPTRAEQGKHDVCVRVATQAHHLDGVRAGMLDVSRMIASCKPCNIAEGDPTKGRHGDPPATVIDYW